MDSCKISKKYNKGNFHEKYRLGSLLGSGAFADVRVVVKISEGNQTQNPDTLLNMRRSKSTASADSQKNAPSTNKNDIFAAKLIYKSKTKIDVLARELQLLCDLPYHKNITTLHEWFDNGDLIILIMDLAVGGDVFDRLDEVEMFTEKDAAEIMYTLLDTMTFCHANGIIHRDIKPENILYSTKECHNRDIKITDFGLGIKDGGGKDSVKTICGTPAYIAPEILSGKGYGNKIDVYACGILCFELLTGHSPFEELEDDVMNLYTHILTTGVQINNKEDPVWDSVSTECRKFILSVCSPKEQERPSASEAMKHHWFVSMGVTPEATATGSVECLLDKIRSNAELRKAKPLKRAAQTVLAMLKLSHGSSEFMHKDSARPSLPLSKVIEEKKASASSSKLTKCTSLNDFSARSKGNKDEKQMIRKIENQTGAKLLALGASNSLGTASSNSGGATGNCQSAEAGVIMEDEEEEEDNGGSCSKMIRESSLDYIVEEEKKAKAKSTFTAIPEKVKLSASSTSLGAKGSGSLSKENSIVKQGSRSSLKPPLSSSRSTTAASSAIGGAMKPTNKLSNMQKVGATPVVPKTTSNSNLQKAVAKPVPKPGTIAPKPASSSTSKPAAPVKTASTVKKDATSVHKKELVKAPA
eukprot:Nk52_evm33s272 gene=Nk52_evmTU33s272